MKGGEQRLILFTRFPEPGKTKTRLIPLLGAEGAADLHRRMTEKVLAASRIWQRASGARLEVCYEGGSADLFGRWLGEGLSFRPQGSGDLGERMSRAFAEAFREGADRVVLSGTDVPGLTEEILRSAFQALQEADLVLGPAKDGGYYLVGLLRPVPDLFSGISWGSEKVLAETLRAAQIKGLRVSLLEPLSDIDRPEDVSVRGEISAGRGDPAALAGSPRPFPLLRPGGEEEGPGTSRGAPGHQPRRVHLPHGGKREEALPRISIIIPALNEEEGLASCLERTLRAERVERLVIDGGSRDRTAEIARSWGARVLIAPRGRARQMNLGASEARGEILLFLHADTLLPEGFDRRVRECALREDMAAGAFTFRLDASSPGLRFIARMANWRSRFLQLPYGDQAIFLRAALFHEVGGFADLPILEDLELIRRLRQRGRIRTLPQAAVTSARRWRQLGVWTATLINELILLAYYLGIPPSRIHSWFREQG